jgi:hypothetical protein
MLQKGSGFLRMLESSPSYKEYARNTYYGKILSDDGSLNMISTTKVGEASIDDRKD